MQRSRADKAVILNIKPHGENNYSVVLLTPQEGILYASLYGGPKSRLKSLVAQWNSGNIWLYENSEKKQIKITDFEVSNFHESFSQNLYKMYAASLAAEILIKTRCAGSNEQAFKLFSGFIDGMELCDEEACRLGLMRFLWRYLQLLGIQPDASCCGSCGENFLSIKFAPSNISYYNCSGNNFICEECSGSSTPETTSGFIPVKVMAVKYLSAVANLSPSEVRQIKIDREAYEQIRNLVFFLIETGIDQKLNTIETGTGIL